MTSSWSSLGRGKGRISTFHLTNLKFRVIIGKQKDVFILTERNLKIS